MSEKILENYQKLAMLNKYAEESGLINDPRWQKLLITINRFPEKANLYNFAEKVLLKKAAKQRIIQDPLFPYPQSEEIRGEIRLGHVVQTGDPVYLKLDSLNRNILITGAHGTGKTNTINLINKGLLEKEIPFLEISIAKQDSRHSIRRFPEIQVIRAAKDFKFNILKPPEGVNAKEWLNDFIDCYSHLTEVMERSESLLVKIVDELYRMFGVYEGSNEYPNLEDLEELLYEKMNEPGFRNDDFLLRNYLRCYKLNTLTDIFKCSEGSDIKHILSKPTILELDGLHTDVMNHIIVFLLTWILRYRLTKRQRGKLIHVTIIDECKRIFPRSLELTKLGTPPIDFLVSYAREFGEGLIVADQEISKLTNTLRANTNTKITFFTSGIDLMEIARTFNLDDEQQKVVADLPTGAGLIKMEG